MSDFNESRKAQRGKYVTTVGKYDIYYSDDLKYSIWDGDNWFDDNFQSVEAFVSFAFKVGLIK